MIVVRIKDNAQVRIRKMRIDDLEKSLRFFRTLTEEDRRYLRVDVTAIKVIEKRIQDLHSQNIIRLVAEAKDLIIGDATLEIGHTKWESHIGELRIIVAPKYQNKGLGSILVKELILKALERGLEKLMIRVMRPQEGVKKLFKPLGFADEVILPAYAKDQNGEVQDLIVMTCDLKKVKDRLLESINKSREQYLVREE